VLRKGERVGDWIVEAPLGEGGMGAVYRVHSALTRRLMAALKAMKPSAEADARARFVREAEALSALRHPAIVRVMGFSEDPERDLLYIVMELAVGETLRARLQRGPMEVPEALATFVPLAQGLDHAHSTGVFHRDLKPSNVILSRDGTPRLVDFGIAAAQQTETLTRNGQLGTLAYLPPEAFRGERAEPAAIDVYAFGLLMHEALTGERPFPVDSGLTPAAASASVGVRKLQAAALELPPQMPGRLRDLVRRATEPDPKLRPTMREVRATLESLVERRTAASDASRLVASAPAGPFFDEDVTTRVPDPTPPLGAAATEGPSTAGRGRRRGDRLRLPLITAVALAVAGLALAVVLVPRRPAAGRPLASASAPAALAGHAVRPPTRTRLSPSAVPSSAPIPGAAAERAAAEAKGEPKPSPSARAEVSPAPPAPKPAPPVERVRTVAPEPPAEAEDLSDDETDNPAPGHVDGRWEVVDEVESTSYAGFAGLKVGYRLTLFQDGDRVRGRGQKFSENGVLLLPSQRTSIEVVGRIVEGQLVLSFTEFGRERVSRGTLRWALAPDGSTMRGRFESDAAGSRGASIARRLP